MGSSDTTIELIEMSRAEVQLLRIVRNGPKFGEIVIRLKDGKPYQIVRVQEMVNLST